MPSGSGVKSTVSLDALGRHPPGAVALGERECRPAETASRNGAPCPWLGTSDVQVEHGPPEKLVTNGSPDDPGLLVGQDLSYPLIHSRHAARTPGAGVEAGRDLVSDRAGDSGMVLDQDPVADERHRRPGWKPLVELDRERVHRDRSHHATSLALDEHLRTRQVPPEAVGIADRDDSDPRGLLGDEEAPVARALTPGELLHEREIRLPAKSRLQAVGCGIRPEG